MRLNLGGSVYDPTTDPYGLLGLSEGDVHVIRNAGGVITDDEVRSLTISQRLLGPRDHPHPPHRLRHWQGFGCVGGLFCEKWAW